MCELRPYGSETCEFLDSFVYLFSSYYRLKRNPYLLFDKTGLSRYAPRQKTMLSKIIILLTRPVPMS